MLMTTRGLAAVTIPIAEEDTEAQRAGGTGWGSNAGRGFRVCAPREGQEETQSRSKDVMQGVPGGGYLLPVAA